MKRSEFSTTLSLIKRISQGDSKAFKTVFDTYYKRLYAFSLNYLKDEYATEEVVETVFITLWQRRDKLNKVNNLKAYLYSMARNASIDFLKKKKKHVQFDINNHDAVSLMDTFIIEEETYAILFKALDALPAKSRKIFELSCLEGVKYKDIAEDMDISINTVKSQRYRAIQILKTYLKDYEYFKVILF